MAVQKVQATKNYRLFSRSDDNRQTDLKKHRKLVESMKLYGFLPCFPVVCCRDKNGNLVVKDGQHRLVIAEELGLTVHWIEETINFDVAIVNSTAKIWVLRDYAEKFAANGLKDYQAGLDFAGNYSLPVGTAFALLAGTTTFSNTQTAFINGDFRVKDQAWAKSVAELYAPLSAIQPAIKTMRLIEACMAICRIADFDRNRMIHGAERCRDKLVPYSTRDAYLAMLEEVYNFGRVKLVPLKMLAIMAMRDRNIIPKKKAKKEAVAV